MKKWLLKKDDVKNLCLNACSEWETYLPLEDFGEEVQFMKLDNKEKGASLDKLNLDYESLVIPPKVIAFPQLETLFKYDDEKIIPTVKPPVKKLLFGVRACDAKAISFMDNFFKKDFEDIYYLNRSKNKLVVIVGCKQPLEDCFCTSTKTGPFLQTGFDLQLVDIGDKYVVEVGSKKGEEFVINYSKFFQKPSQNDVKHSQVIKQDLAQAVSLRLDFEKAIKKFCEDKVPKQIYERIAERCIYCGGCLYVCPTCSCFNVYDEKLGSGSKRYRNWDGCIFEGYTREASGNNPRAEKWLRTSRRYEHKLKYDYITTGMSGCVGCGRCLRSCPVNIGISQVIEEVTKDITYVD